MEIKYGSGLKYEKKMIERLLTLPHRPQLSDTVWRDPRVYKIRQGPFLRNWLDGHALIWETYSIVCAYNYFYDFSRV